MKMSALLAEKCNSLSFWKREILDDFENNVPSSRKHQRRVTGNVNINQLCWDWFQDFVY
jgi:hypothetical protein